MSLSFRKLRVLIAPLIYLLGSYASGTLAADGEAEGEIKRDPLEIYVASAPGVRSDLPGWKVAGALLAWEKHLSKATGTPVEVTLFDDVEMLFLAVGGDSVAGIVVPTAESKRLVGMVPEYLIENEGGLTSSFVLAAPAVDGGDSGEGFTRVLLVDSIASGTWVARKWAQAALKSESGLATRGVEGSGAVVIPLFFRQAAFGVTGSGGWIREIGQNPQVTEQVRIVLKSPPLLGDMVLLGEELGKGLVQVLRRELASGAREAPGKTLFQHLGWKAMRPVGETEMEWVGETVKAVDDGLGDGEGGSRQSPLAASGVGEEGDEE